MLILALLSLLALTACGSEDDDAGGDVVEEIQSVESLRERADDLDGKVVTVRSNYWSNADGQYLSDIMMESYPPQIPFDMAVILDGEMPQSVLDLLNHADPSFAEVTWGEVDVTGEVSVDGDEVHLEISEAFAVQS